MEAIADHVQRRHLGVADFDARSIGPRVECARDLQSGLGCRDGDQLDDRQSTGSGREHEGRNCKLSEFGEPESDQPLTAKDPRQDFAQLAFGSLT